MRLRARLLAAFLLVAVPPLLLLAGVANALIARSFDRAARQRLEEALEAARAEVGRRTRRAEAQVAAVLREDLAEAARSPDEEREAAGAIAAARGLDALEIVDDAGRVVSSAHWPAGFGLPDRDQLFPGDDRWRIETHGEGYGATERLAWMASRRGQWGERAVLVRGGPFLDSDFAAELSGLMGLEVALRDEAHGRWIAPPRSPLRSWAAPRLTDAERTALSLEGRSFRWTAAPLHRDLWLVAATPRTALDALTSEVRRLSLALAAAAGLAAIAAAFLFSGRIARPVRELADGARRVAEGELARRVPVDSEDEIGELGRAFNSMTDELRSSRERLLQAERVAAWREMGRRLAHELKNPLFPIQLSIETLRRALDQPAAEADGDARFRELFRESSDTILQELSSLRKIVDEFGEFARLPRPRLESTDLNAVVEQVLALYRPRAEGVALEASLSPGLPRVRGDRDLLARAIGNLVANAIEAMPDGGALRVRTSAAEDGVAVEVADTGPGLSEEQRARLFTPYYTTKQGGTGLGLAIAQGIVSDHGGRVRVASEPGQGATFTLLLPAAPS